MSSMRGLTQFIADIRNARARELEEKRINKELAHIRQKFRDGNLSGYDKKKYVCKLLYVYILGWNVDFGHLEAVNLISASKYSEKQIGYLAVTLFLHEHHELLHLVVNSIRKDLLDHNELNNCLALQAIANVGGKDLGDALSRDVHSLLISPTSQSFVKKKAALTLLRLYRKQPSIVQLEWAERIISLMDDPDLGVTLSVTSLVMAMARDNLEQYKGCYVKAAHRLKKIVVDHDYAADYVYYKVPCPWIQVKFLRLLQYYPPSEDTHVRDLIRQSLRRILDAAMDAPQNVQQNNAQNAVLFEAINLIIHLDTEQDLVGQISSKLGKFIQSKETNVRYLGLDAMTHLAARAETLDPIKRHQRMIIGSLRDRDISVRRKGLDLLYSMCDTTNAQAIVSELLRYLQTADYAIREEMVLKIAIVTEKYATDGQWYVDISLRLIAMAGEHVSDEVWQRVVQVITNNEELQVYATRNALKYIQQDMCHDTLLKIGAYVLGEFGHLIADQAGCSPMEQFVALQAKLPGCSTRTKALVLSCFVKFVNLFPEIKPALLLVFGAYSHALDAELQQRACEYLALATLPTDDLLRTVCDEMPPFSQRKSVLLSRLHQKHAGATDKPTWVIGGKDANAPGTASELADVGPGLKRSFTTNGFVGTASASPSPSPTAAGRARNGASPSTADTHAQDLAGLELTANGGRAAVKAPNLASAAHLSPNWERGYEPLLQRNEGVLYEDAQIQVGLRSEYRGQMGCVILYFTNKAATAVAAFTTSYDGNDDSGRQPLRIDTKNLPDAQLEAEAQTQQTVMFEARHAFAAAPTVRISYLAGALQALTLQLPVVLHKFMDRAALSADDFFRRWKQIGGPPRETQRVFRLAVDVAVDRRRTKMMAIERDERPDDASARDVPALLRQTVRAFNWGVLEGVDPNPTNVVGASVLHTTRGGKYGCLLRLEPNLETRMCRLTIRATDEAVAPVLLKVMVDTLSKGMLASRSNGTAAG
ncbi:MAG: hypothetical protein M1826_006115 [Phylliscum demangeonii]|nr:MAG: hypothetical protein M1826_006115 [Phylliscum demangeonii]